MNASKPAKRRASLGGSGGGGGASPGAVVGGDLTGTTGSATVVAIQGVPVDNAVPVSGDKLIFDGTDYVPGKDVSYFASGAAAQAAAPHINGTTVIISPGSPTTEAGTYQVTANGGAAFPADYTKVSDHTNTASELGVVDTDDHYDGTDAEAVLKNIAEGAIRGIKFPLLIGTNVIDAVLAATYPGSDWAISLTKGTLTYKATLSVAHDGALTSLTEHSAAVGTGIGVLPVSFDADITGLNLRMLAVATEAGWSCHIRRTALMEA